MRLYEQPPQTTPPPVSDTSGIVRQGVAAAKAGQNDQARELFLKAARENPTDELAWICLATIATSLPLRISHLQKALEINPASERARSLLVTTRKQQANSLLERARSASTAGQFADAEHFLLGAVEADPQCAAAWLKLTQLPEPPESPAVLLYRGLEANPSNTELRARLAEIEATTRTVEADPPVSEPSVTEVDPVQDTAPADATPVVTVACLFCDERIDVSAAQCSSCGGRQSIWDPAGDPSATAADVSKMIGAVNRFNETLRRNPRNAAVYFALGVAYLNLRRIDVALHYLRRSQQMEPDPARQTAIDAILRNRQPTPNPEPVPPAMAPEPANPTASAATTASGPGNGKMVLVIDDSPTIRRVVSITLERQGYSVVTAVDGLDGLNKLNEGAFDLVLLDIMMPRMDGYQVCKLIRDQQRHLPVVMLSGKDGFFDKVRGKMAGSTAYITKPFERDVLLETVRGYCAAGQPPASRVQ